MRHKHKRTDKPLTRLQVTKKGTIKRKIIGVAKDNGREYTLHATKGYRSTLA